MNRYTIHPREDVIRDPELPGDQAEIGIVCWEVWCDKGDCVDSFETEVEAAEVAQLLNEDDAAFDRDPFPAAADEPGKGNAL